MRLRFLLFFAVLLFAAQAGWGETLVGKVVGVSDGDTLTFLTREKKRIRVRLYGIDAPELNQAFGARSKQSLSAMVFGQAAKLVTVDVDPYGRTVAWVYAGALNANEEQVKAGMAWWYFNYAQHETRLRNFERTARAAKLGLWVEANPTPPWVFRRHERGAVLPGKSHRAPL